MNLSGYHACVFRASVIFLACILVFGVVFSLLPSGGDVARSGVTLAGVRFNLYPEQDQGAVWRFQARQVTVDPLKNENTLDGLGQGERWIKARQENGVWVPDANGQEHLDMTLKAEKLVIDSDDNLKAKQARLYVIQDCTTLTLQSNDKQQVVINQRSGYNTPYLAVSSPNLKAEYDDVSSNFDFKNFRGSQRPQGQDAGFNPSAPTRCLNGKIVPSIKKTTLRAKT